MAARLCSVIREEPCTNRSSGRREQLFQRLHFAWRPVPCEKVVVSSLGRGWDRTCRRCKAHPLHKEHLAPPSLSLLGDAILSFTDRSSNAGRCLYLTTLIGLTSTLQFVVQRSSTGLTPITIIVNYEVLRHLATWISDGTLFFLKPYFLLRRRPRIELE